MADLTLKQQKFIDFYMGEANGNGRRAAELAGYEGARHVLEQVAHENLRKPEIREEISQLYREKIMPAEEVLGRLSEISKGPASYLKAITENKGTIDVQRLLDDGMGHLIKGFKYTEGGQCIVEFYDSLAAIREMGRYHKLFVDKVEHDFGKLSDSELAERIAALERGETTTPDVKSEEQGDQ